MWCGITELYMPIFKKRIINNFNVSTALDKWYLYLIIILILCTNFWVFRDDLHFFMLYYLFINKCLVDLISGPILKGVLLTCIFLIITVLRNWIMPLNIILITCKQINRYQQTNSLVRKISMLVTLNGEMCFKCYLCTFIWFLYMFETIRNVKITLSAPWTYKFIQQHNSIQCKIHCVTNNLSTKKDISTSWLGKKWNLLITLNVTVYCRYTHGKSFNFT